MYGNTNGVLVFVVVNVTCTITAVVFPYIILQIVCVSVHNPTDCVSVHNPTDCVSVHNPTDCLCFHH